MSPKNVNEKSEFDRLQADLNTIEKSINFVEKADLQKERISQRLDAIMQKIDELTTNEAGKLEKKEKLILEQQIDRIKLKIGIKTKTALSSLKTGIVWGSSLADRPPEVAANIEKSADNIKHIAKGRDENPVANLMQWWMEKLLA